MRASWVSQGSVRTTRVSQGVRVGDEGFLGAKGEVGRS